MIESTPSPQAVTRLDPTDIVEVDVREDLRQGREPFTRIMDAREALSEGAVLVVRAIFEPAPLYGVMEGFGFDHITEELGPEDWRVWFYPPARVEGEGTASGRASDSTDPPSSGSSPADEEAGPAGEAARPADAADNLVVLDVRGLEPPEPMVRTLEALETLSDGATLLQINVRVPRFLLPQLEQRGFEYEVREQSDGPVRVFIWKSASGAA